MLSYIKHIIRNSYYGLRYHMLSKLRSSICVLNSWESVDWIIKHKCSVSRFGDGELNMIFNYQDREDSRPSGFQQFDAVMGQRLCEILREGGSSKYNHYVAIQQEMFGIGTNHMRSYAASFWKEFTVRYLKRILTMLSPSKTYLNTGFSRFYLSKRDKSRCAEYVEFIKEIWKDRDVVIVEGESTRLGVGNNLFSCARSVKRILCPATNAWSKYDKILCETSKQLSGMSDNVLCLCALGMTATILSRDLAQKGFQAVDLGHIDIEYEWMLRGATTKISIPGKYTNENVCGHNPAPCTDSQYISEILSHIS